MRLDQKLGSELAAQLSGSLGAVAAWERKVELLLRNCWLRFTWGQELKPMH